MRYLKADAVFVNGKIRTQDFHDRVVQAIAVKDGRILVVGQNAEVQNVCGDLTECHDLGGRTVIPGLIDSHLHLLSFGQSLDRIVLSDTASIEQMKRALSQKVAEAEPQTWLFGRGWDQDRLSESRYPNRDDLDEVSPDNPVVLTRACGHVSVVNSAALKIANIDENTPDPAGGVIDRDNDGRPTGIFRERAMDLIRVHIPEPSREELLACLRNAMRAAVRAGLTSIHTNDGVQAGLDIVPELYRTLHRQGERLRVYWDVPCAHADELLASAYRTGSGDEYFKFGSVKMFIDGSLGGRTAALDGWYADEPGNNGVLVLEPAQLDELVLRCHAAGMQVAAHAIGDRGVRLVLDAIHKADMQVPRPGSRHRVIHCQIMTPELYDRFAALGVVADIQPKFVTTDMLWAENRVGRDKAKTSYAWKTFLDRGIPAAGGSDCPVEPIEPMLGIYAAVTRCDMQGQPEDGWMPEQRLSVNEAVRLFTQGGAFAAYEEHSKGTLEAGKLADFVVLDSNIYEIDPMDIIGVRPVMTVIGGKVVYSV